MEILVTLHLISCVITIFALRSYWHHRENLGKKNNIIFFRLIGIALMLFPLGCIGFMMLVVLLYSMLMIFEMLIGILVETIETCKFLLFLFGFKNRE